MDVREPRPQRVEPPERRLPLFEPGGAEPFASYEGEQHFAILPPGATFEHTFTVPGEYVYVCVPHAGQGMIGTVRVSE
ncbi:plastocyanin/azurin family copper-binding protein [Halobaculum litoreum]|uniref:Plastocyanin/azurin family copper-binding protein n=1 Tax=Halobaculum litoreum TaxID=3031998 RepID=A0ABD5XSA8_9EURY